ncbi:CrcB family protein [Amycolatopsis sp. FDAARGOS 1241]|uniref:fluoride efflux transporter FluC n=1 Tax=Amycolatopsis sp. FDAARGOS 1241 TaxID=2778070 RepID=UPI001EF29969|nr:CrcB family protein [Amycolatopsis sp. FDAARGOS 1241]
MLVVIAVGGGVGAVSRYGLAERLPTQPRRFPWGTFVTNVVGCFLIDVLMVLIAEVWVAHRLVRPFLGVGVARVYHVLYVRGRNPETAAAGTVSPAFVYLAGILISAMLAVIAGGRLTRRVSSSSGAGNRAG